MLVFSSNSITAEIGDVVIENWDNKGYSAGDYNGLSTYVDWERVSGDDFIVTTQHPQSGTLCLNLNDDDSGGTNGYINITNFSYDIFSITIKGYYNYVPASYGHAQHIYFRNSNGDNIISFVIVRSDSYYVIDSNGGTHLNGVLYYDMVKGWIAIRALSGSSSSSNFIFTAALNTSYAGNGVDYSFKDGSTWYNKTGVTASNVGWDNIASIYCHSVGHTDSGHVDCYLDDIVFNINDNTEEAIPQLSGAIVEHNGIIGLHDVSYSGLNTFKVYPIGDESSRLGIEIKKGDDVYYYNQNIIFPLVSAINPLTFQLNLAETGTYSFRAYDVLNSDGYNETSYFTVTSPINYTETYGDGLWAVIITDGSRCYYEAGDYLDIAVHLPYDATNNSESDYYKILFYAMGSSEDGTHVNGSSGYAVDYLLQHYDDDVHIIEDVTELFTFGQWRVEVWKCDSNNTILGELYNSPPVYICPPTTEYNHYSISLSPPYTSFNRNETVSVTITKTGSDRAYYYVYTPYNKDRMILEGTLESNEMETTFEIDFNDYNDSYLGEWAIRVFDYDGSMVDFNAVTKRFKVVSGESSIEPETYTTLEEKDVNFIVGLGITLALGGMGLGIGTRLNNGDGMLVLGLVFTVLGTVMSAWFGLFPLWVPFTVGLFPAAYIVSKIYGGK